MAKVTLPAFGDIFPEVTTRRPSSRRNFFPTPYPAWEPELTQTIPLYGMPGPTLAPLAPYLIHAPPAHKPPASAIEQPRLSERLDGCLLVPASNPDELVHTRTGYTLPSPRTSAREIRLDAYPTPPASAAAMSPSPVPARTERAPSAAPASASNATEPPAAKKKAKPRTYARAACPAVTPTAAPEVSFDILRPAGEAGLVHVASSKTRWTAIPLLPLPPRRGATAAPGPAPTPGAIAPPAELTATPSPLPSANGGPISAPPYVSGGRGRARSEGSGQALARASLPKSRKRASTNVADGLRPLLSHRPLRPRPLPAPVPLPKDLYAGLYPSNEAPDSGSSLKRRKESDIARRHACPTCGKRFNRPSSVRTHLHTHNGTKPYDCPWPACDKQFNVSSNMRRHYRTHFLGDGASAGGAPGFGDGPPAYQKFEPLTYARCRALSEGGMLGAPPPEYDGWERAGSLGSSMESDEEEEEFGAMEWSSGPPSPMSAVTE